MSSSVTAEVVAAFVDERDGGNLAGIVFDRADLSEDQMQSIAAQLGYSETAFLSEVIGGFRFDVFTPKIRVPDCGPVGTFWPYEGGTFAIASPRVEARQMATPRPAQQCGAGRHRFERA
jgi:PhzF family phenazine biosynthesis protein